MDSAARAPLMGGMQHASLRFQSVRERARAAFVHALTLAATGLAMLAAVVAVPAASAQATWDFTAGTGAPATLGSNLAGGTLSAAHLASGALAFNNTSASNQAGASGGDNAAVQAAAGAFASATSTYFEFTLTAAAGLTPVASGLSIGNRSTTTGPGRLALYSSVDGFSVALATAAVTADGAWHTIALPAFSLAGAAGGSITFRLFGSEGSGTGTGNWRIDDMALSIVATDAPHITTPPLGATVVTFAPVSFTVVAATVAGPLTYQWRKNGAAITGASAATLTFPSATAADAGVYDVMVTNLVGSAVSAPATLVVAKAAATITLAGLSEIYDGLPHAAIATTVPAGLAVDLTYNGSATAPTAAGTYTTAATVTDPNYQGSTSGSLTIARAPQTIAFSPSDHLATDPAATLSATATSGLPVTFALLAGPATLNGAVVTLMGTTGAVSVRASQAGNANFQPAADVDRSFQVLTVFVAPVITLQPAPFAGLVGDTITLRTAASGTPAPQFQWQKNGVPIADATASTFILLHAAIADAALYTCVATNSAGSVVTAAASVQVSKRPQAITFPPPSTAYPAGTAVTLAANASSGLAVTFTIVNGAATLGGRILVAQGGDVSIRALQAGDATYAAAPPVEQTFAFLAGGLAPFLTSGPESGTVGAGESFTFRASAVGTPAPTYQWKKDGENLPGATTNTFTIAAATAADSGRYQFVATNPLGVATAAATLTLRPAPAGGGVVAAPAPSTPPVPRRLINLSARAFVLPGAPLIAGFVIGGTAPQRVLVRGVGPTLAAAPFDLPDALLHPRLTLFRAGTVLLTSDDWAREPDVAPIRDVAVAVGAFPLGLDRSDAALLVSLEPGAYTAQVSGAGDASGVALVEVYDAEP